MFGHWTSIGGGAPVIDYYQTARLAHKSPTVTMRVRSNPHPTNCEFFINNHMSIAAISHDKVGGSIDTPCSATSAQHFAWTYFRQALTLLLTILTLDIPSFHNSLASKESPLGKYIPSFLYYLHCLLNLAQACQIPSMCGRRPEALLVYYSGACLVQLSTVTPPLTFLPLQSIDRDALQSRHPIEHRHLVSHHHLIGPGNSGLSLLQHSDHLFLKP